MTSPYVRELEAQVTEGEAMVVQLAARVTQLEDALRALRDTCCPPKCDHVGERDYDIDDFREAMALVERALPNTTVIGEPADSVCTCGGGLGHKAGCPGYAAETAHVDPRPSEACPFGRFGHSGANHGRGCAGCDAEHVRVFDKFVGPRPNEATLYRTPTREEADGIRLMRMLKAHGLWAAIEGGEPIDEVIERHIRSRTETTEAEATEELVAEAFDVWEGIARGKTEGQAILAIRALWYVAKAARELVFAEGRETVDKRLGALGLKLVNTLDVLEKRTTQTGSVGA